jgi:predicted nucleic acid-binding protein
VATIGPATAGNANPPDADWAEDLRELRESLAPATAEVAEAHATLPAHTRKSGTPRGLHDLIIAATALARGRRVVTLDRGGFADLPGVSVVDPA